MITSNTIPNLLVWKEGHTMISGEAAFIYSSQFGVPPELFKEMVNELFSKNKFAKAYHVAKAYDLAHGTNHADSLKTNDDNQ